MKIDDQWLTIWTSSWIWEEILILVNTKAKDDETKYSNILKKLQGLDIWTDEEAQIELEKEKNADLRNKVITFEQKMDINLL